MNSGETLITIKNLRKYYPVRKSNPFEKKSFVKAVDGVDFSILKGETFGLVGESGCGKSTTGHMLVNLLTPTEGQIIYEGKNITRLNGKEQQEMRKDIQIIFQDPFASLNPKKKIGWLLEEPLVIHNAGDKASREEMVEKMLDSIGLDSSFKHRYPHQLSGGQRQRVSIAIALMLKPKFVVADESVSALDVSIQAQILNLMKKLQREMKLTYLFISHDLNVVEYMSDRIGVMYLGRLVELGAAKDIYEKPLHPYTQALFSSIPDIKGKNRERIILSGDVPSPAAPPAGCPFHTRCFRAQHICSREIPEPKYMDNGRIVTCHLL